MFILLLAAAPARAATPLQKFANARVVETPGNDGDSFVVESGARRIHVRLYFVDCPESTAVTDADAKRVREQARLKVVVKGLGWWRKRPCLRSQRLPANPMDHAV